MIPWWIWIVAIGGMLVYSKWVGWAEENRDKSIWARRSDKFQIYFALAFVLIGGWLVYVTIAAGYYH